MLEKIAPGLNMRPRKRFDFKCPIEVMSELMTKHHPSPPLLQQPCCTQSLQAPELKLDRTILHERVDTEENNMSWHQVIKPFISNEEKRWKNLSEKGTVLIGFCCDEGIRRNSGRIGAKEAPNAIRKAMTNLYWHGTKPIYDAGNITCDDGNLEKAQRKLVNKIFHPLYDEHLPIILAGGHEVAFASWLGIVQYLFEVTHFKGPGTEPNIGIINFDSNFDLHTPKASTIGEYEQFQWILGDFQAIGSSGTPFKQISDACKGPIKFQYAAIGISRFSNTQRLFERAQALNTWVLEDKEINQNTLPTISEQLNEWMQDKEVIYLSFDVGVLPAHQAPGCSAPATLGVELNLLLPLIEQIKKSGKLILADIAEVNPAFDIDNRTARVAARIVHLLHSD